VAGVKVGLSDKRVERGDTLYSVYLRFCAARRLTNARGYLSRAETAFRICGKVFLSSAERRSTALSKCSNSKKLFRFDIEGTKVAYTYAGLIESDMDLI
jgi:hypothetical protein